MRKTLCVWTGALALCTVSSGWAAGLQPQDGLWAWDNFKSRLSLGISAPFRTELTSNANEAALKVNSVSLMSDYYVTRPLLGDTGGVRATSGVVLGSRSPVWSSPSAMDTRNTGLDGDSSTTPYVGMGYTSMSGKSGWGWSADLGVMALNPRSAVRLGRVFTGAQGLDDTVRDLRLSPVLQLGVSYAF